MHTAWERRIIASPLFVLLAIGRSDLNLMAKNFSILRFRFPQPSGTTKSILLLGSSFLNSCYCGLWKVVFIAVHVGKAMGNAIARAKILGKRLPLLWLLSILLSNSQGLFERNGFWNGTYCTFPLQLAITKAFL